MRCSRYLQAVSPPYASVLQVLTHQTHGVKFVIDLRRDALVCVGFVEVYMRVVLPRAERANKYSRRKFLNSCFRAIFRAISRADTRLYVHRHSLEPTSKEYTRG